LQIELIDLLSALSILIPCATSIYFFRSAGSDMRFFAVFIYVSLISSSAVAILAAYEINNLWLIHIFIPIEYGFLVLLFSFWQRGKLVRRILRWSIVVFFGIWIWSKLIHLERLDHFYYPTKSLSTIVLITVSIFTLITINVDELKLIYKDYRFWVILGVLVYFAGTAVVFSLSDLALIKSVWTIHSILNITGNICFACAFLFLSPRS
jgi:hypothetical protein